MKPGGRFVWVKGLKGPVPEKWPHDMPAGGTLGKDVVHTYELGADEFALKIAILEQRYPAPKPPEPEPPHDPEPSPTTPSPSTPPSAPAVAKAVAAA
jgi:hypothetical protein